MEVTNQNAGILLPHIAAQLRDCAYFAVDLEFTGIDRDAAEVDADKPVALTDSLMRKPRDMYPKKLETLKPFSIIQIGLSIFSRCPSKPVKNALGVPPHSTGGNATGHLVQELVADAKDFVADGRESTYYTNFIEQTVELYTRAVSCAEPPSDVNGWEAALTFVSQETARVGEMVAAAAVAVADGNTKAPRSSTDTAYATNSIVELLRRCHFLEVLFSALGRRSRETVQVDHTRAAVASSSTTQEQQLQQQQSPPPVLENYHVQTFTAYMFPAVTNETQSVTLNVDTAEFLVKNKIDLMRWLTDGLRFKPFPNVAADFAAGAAHRLKNIKQLLQPHKVLPRFTECFNSNLDDILPLSLGELQLVKFVLDLFENSSSPAAPRVGSFYVSVVRRLILFSRFQLPESSLPNPIYTTGQVYRDEMTALAAIDVTKENRKYTRKFNFIGGTASSGNSGNGGEVATSLPGYGALRPSTAAQGYGTALFEVLLYATEVLQKPIVFYNGYTDLIFLLLSLYGPQRMPPTLDEFKVVVHRHFPVLYDTRILTCAGPLQALGNFTGRLSKVVEQMAKIPTVASNVSFQFDGATVGGDDPAQYAAAHNAGFDAMMTGKLFAYATYAITQTGARHEVYVNLLSSYSTLLSINLTEKEDSVLQEEPTPIFFLAETCGLNVDSIREVLGKAGLTALVIFRGNGYTVQPVGKSCHEPNYLNRFEQELTRQVLNTSSLVRINIPAVRVGG